jgi:type II secretory pathway component PulJ
MCMMALSIVTSLAGAALSAAGQMQQAQVQAANYKYQAELNRRQQIMEKEAGRFEADKTLRRSDRTQSGMRAAISAGGVDLSSGSALDVQMDSAIEAQRDVDAIRWNASMKAEKEGLDAKMNMINAGQAIKAGQIGAAGALVGGLSSVAGQLSGSSGSFLAPFGGTGTAPSFGSMFTKWNWYGGGFN